MSPNNWGVEFARLSFDELFAKGRVSESQRNAYYLGVAAGIGLANERLSPHSTAAKQLKSQL